MKVFISQPMNGRSDEEILKERDNITKSLIEKFGNDVEIIDSFFKDEIAAKYGPVAMLGSSISLMCDADVVVFAPLWECTRGCQVEHLVARKYEFETLYVYDRGNGEMFITEFYLE